MDQRYGLRKVFFIDNAFNIPTDHAKQLCQALIAAEDIKTNWNTCLAPFECDPELLALMKQAGCALVIMGGHAGRPTRRLGPQRALGADARSLPPL